MTSGDPAHLGRLHPFKKPRGVKETVNVRNVSAQREVKPSDRECIQGKETQKENR